MAESLRSPVAHCTIDGESYSVTSINIRSGINAIPVADIVAHPSSARSADIKASEVLTSDVVSKIGSYQNTIFSGVRLDPNASLSIDDGNGGQLTFSGILSSPKYTHAFGSVGYSFQLVQKSNALLSLNPSIYTYTNKNVTQGDILPSNISSISSAIPEIYDFCRDNWKSWFATAKNRKDLMASTEVSALEMIDSMNEKIKPLFYEMLGNSDMDTFSNELSQITVIPAKQAISRNIANIIRARSGSYLSTILNLAESYQCAYIPSYDGYGALKGYGSLLEAEGTITLDLAQLYVNAGNTAVVPFAAVAVTHPRAANVVNGINSPAVSALYPPQLPEGGTLYNISGPEWLPPNYVSVGTKVDGSIPSLEEIEDAVNNVDTDIGDQHKISAAILYKWAYYNYIRQIIGKSEITVTIPLDVTLEVGKSYNIMSSTGTSIGTGLLDSITHQLALNGGGNSSCQTHLVFSYCEVGGYKLPYKLG